MFCSKHKFNSSNEYKEFLKNNPNMITENFFTSKPERVYKDDGWKGWADFLGKEK